ncbi:MAG: ABC transporter permease [Opitutus sp.]|nr:ABC transporter permease [Opitutus sp.]
MLSDLRYAVRALLRAPAFSLIAILTLALCIGANSAIFSVIHSVLLKPYPWPNSDRLVYCYNNYRNLGLENVGVSIPDFLDRSTQVEGFADAAIYNIKSFNLTEGAQPERVVGLVASPSLFSTLQTGAAHGRVLTSEDAVLGATKTVVLSHALWSNRFGADTGIVGRTIRLNGEPHVVVGVMPESFYFPTPRMQLWVPFVFTDAQRSDNERGTEFSSMIARLKPGVAPESIQRELDLIQARNAQRLPDQAPFWKSAGFGGGVSGFLERNVGEVRGMLWLIQGGVAAALLIGCANVSSLLLARAVARERELAIRAALGAGRARLIRLLVSESLILFGAGGLLGLLVGSWGIDILSSSLMSNLPRAFAIELDGTVFTLTLVCALACGLVFGALPAWSAAKGDAAAALKEAGTRGTAGRRTQFLRSALVVTEIALAVMLLSTAGLLMKSFQRLQEQNPGFNAEHVLTARMSLPEKSMTTRTKSSASSPPCSPPCAHCPA